MPDRFVTEPFEDSRRLTGCNVYFASTGAALETARGLSFSDDVLERWRANIIAARDMLAWPEGDIAVRQHRSGASLAFAAPLDQLYAATEVNEWAWWSAIALPFSLRAPSPGRGREEQWPHPAPGHAAVWDRELAFHTLQALARGEARPRLVALQQAAQARRLPVLIDDDMLSIGTGTGGRSWPMDDLPGADAIDWPLLHAIPAALVTGSNGKTTTVRLLAAMTRAHDLATAYSCTDGVFFDGVALEAGDFSGPTGARTALRQPAAQAAILETARGGMLRRGLALCRADAAIVTNISADHFGEYGIHDLDELAMAKLTVARAIDRDGLLVLNADDAVLVRQSQALDCPIGWFALDDVARMLAMHRAQGGATCGVHDGRLRLHRHGVTHDLGAIAAMPLTLGGSARYNIANIASAALAASALGVAPQTIARVLSRFGERREDNPGRLQLWRFDRAQVVVDYAHNPDGLHGLLQAVGARQRAARLAITLGHAGNREDDDLRAVAATAAAFAPELVVLKEAGGYERGRDPGEIAAIMRDELLRMGVPQRSIQAQPDEVDAARAALAWARDGDLVVLPVFAIPARERVGALLDRMQAHGWKPGNALPDDDGVAE